MGYSRAAQRCRSGFVCSLFRNETVSTARRLQPLSFAFLLAVVACEIMALLMTAGVNDLLFQAKMMTVRGLCTTAMSQGESESRPVADD
jgi:hypothetical protein